MMDVSTGIIRPGDRLFDVSVPVAVIGAGACGCCAALAANERGACVLVIERDDPPAGSTSLSGGQIPAAGTKLQKSAGIEDTPEEFAAEILEKAPLEPPYLAVKVTGALFHTQGGLVVDTGARVLRRGTRRALPNLFAGGGAARGLSGPSCWGYTSGAGLMTATTLGRVAGEGAAALVS